MQEKMIEEDLVLSTPEVIHHKVNPKEDLAVILACDGVWNTFTNEEAALQVSDKLLHRLPASSKRTPATDTKCCADAAQFIVDNAISRGSTDNCTAMVALLEPVVEEHPDVVKANKRSAHCVIL
jgi:serine/threonine protein phosphatase PrpC